MASNLWSHAAYSNVRARLLRPAPDLHMESGSDFMSVQLMAAGGGMQSSDIKEHGEELLPEVSPTPQSTWHNPPLPPPLPSLTGWSSSVGVVSVG